MILLPCSLCPPGTPPVEHDQLTTVTLHRPGQRLVVRKLCEDCALDFTARWYGVAEVRP